MERKEAMLKTGFSKILWAVMLLMLSASPLCQAAVDYLDVNPDETVDLDYEVTYTVSVWGGTLNVLDVAIVHYMEVYPGSTVNLIGGIIDQDGISAFESVNVTIHGSYVSHSPESGAIFDPISNSLVIEDTSVGWTGNLTCTYDEATVTSVIPISTFSNINFTSISGPETIIVDIDIKPGCTPNAINLGSNGVIPVAILSTPDFDATTVNPDTVSLAGSGVAVRGKGNKSLTSQDDVNGDGLLDMIVKVETENLDPDTFQDGHAILTGLTTDGIEFTGSDSITIVPPE